MAWDKEKARSQYAEKLRDPRWQKKRLEVMERDHFSCIGCGNDKETLNVHHKYYVRGKEPWEYELSAFMTLCETCHEFESVNRRTAEEKILLAFKRAGFFAGHLEELAEALETTEEWITAHDPFVSALAKAIRDRDFGSYVLNSYFESIKKR